MVQALDSLFKGSDPVTVDQDLMSYRPSAFLNITIVRQQEGEIEGKIKSLMFEVVLEKES